MKGMTNKQFSEYKKVLMLMILEILEHSKSLKEAKKKIKTLLDKE